MAELDLGNPANRAAMLVLGVLPEELAPLDKAAFAGNEMRYLHLEQKRKNLMDEVLRKASEGQDVHGKPAAMSGPTREERNQAFFDEIARHERENTALMQKLAKKDVQKVVIQELEQKATAKRNKDRIAEGERRLAEAKKAIAEELDKRRKEAEKKQTKIVEVRARALQASVEKGEENFQKLCDANARAEKKIREMKEAEAAQRVLNREKRVHIFIRQEGYEQKKVKHREEMYADYQENMDSKTRKLEEIINSRQSNAEFIAEKQRRTTEKVREFQAEKQAAAEERYRGICERHANAGAYRADNLKTWTKELQVRNTKRLQTHSGRYDKLLEQLEREPGVKLCASSAPGSPQFVIERAEARRSPKKADGEGGQSLAKTFSDSVLMAAERRRNHEHVVHENRDRLRRARHYNVETQLDKLHQNRQRVQVIEDARAEAARKRAIMVATCSREKSHLQHRVDRIKDSGKPEKMYNLLEELDPDPEAVARINGLLDELGLQTIGGGLAKEGDDEAK